MVGRQFLQQQSAGSLVFQHLQLIGCPQELDLIWQIILILIQSWGTSEFPKGQIKNPPGNVLPAQEQKEVSEMVAGNENSLKVFQQEWAHFLL